jgi:hypothetical protein
VLLAIGDPARAQEAPGRASAPIPATCAPGDPTRCAQPLEKGQPAPFPGQLLSPNLAIDLGQKATWCDERLDLELKHAKALAEVDLSLERQLHANDKAAGDAKERLLLGRLEEAKKPAPWYESKVFLVIVSISATALISYGMFTVARISP